MRDAWVQTVIDLRRAVDYWNRARYSERLKSAIWGSVWAECWVPYSGGVEARIAAFCLAVPGGDMVDLVKNIDRYPLLKVRWPVQVTPEVHARVEEIANIIDPIHFVGRDPAPPAPHRRRQKGRGHSRHVLLEGAHRQPPTPRNPKTSSAGTPDTPSIPTSPTTSATSSANIFGTNPTPK